MRFVVWETTGDFRLFRDSRFLLSALTLVPACFFYMVVV
jgi:hypothetical protein